MASSACKGCGESLDWEQEAGRWIAYEVQTGQKHRCPNYQQIKQQRAAPQSRLAPTAAPNDDKDYEVLRVLNRIEVLLKKLVELTEESQQVEFQASHTNGR